MRALYVYRRVVQA